MKIMKQPIRVMVTGAGSGVGQGILKSLSLDKTVAKTLISADIHPLNAALYVADEAAIIPRVEEDNALEKMIDALKSCRPDVVMIGSEFDLLFFAKYKKEIEAATGVKIAVSPYASVEIADDKYLTYEFLKKNNLSYPQTYLPKDVEDACQAADDIGFPVFIKPRRGTSSRGVHLVYSPQELRQIYDSVQNPIIQKAMDVAIKELKNEYTCSVFKCSNGDLLKPFTARRVLRSGHSWIVDVQEFDFLYPLMYGIGKNMEIEGTLNVQLIMTEDGPVPFEFNCRFSGTTAIRAYYGFNEPVMYLKHYCLGEKLPAADIRKGVAFRYAEEVFLDDVTADELGGKFVKGRIMSWF